MLRNLRYPNNVWFFKRMVRLRFLSTLCYTSTTFNTSLYSRSVQLSNHVGQPALNIIISVMII